MAYKIKQKEGYKHTEIGWIPQDWDVDTISNISIISTGNKNTQDKIINGKYPFFVRSSKIERINSYSYDGIAVLTAGDGVGTGKVFHYINGKFDFHQRVYKISNFKDNVVPRYFYEYFRNNFLKEVTKYTAKTSVDSVRLEMISEMKIPIPPLPEQLIISKILYTSEKLIMTISKLIDLKEKRNKALMQQLLTGKKRLKGFKVKWKEYKIYNIFDRVTRKNTENNQNVVTISAQRGFVKQDTFFNKTVASENLLNYFLVERDEFCYNKSYSNGYPWGAVKVLKEFEKAVVTTLYICFKLKDKNENSVNFFEHFFEIGSLNKGLTKIAHEGGRAHGLLNVTPSDFMDLAFKIPNLKEQIAISEVIGSAIKEINLLKQKLELLKKQKQGLMQVLLTGKVRVAT